MILKLKQKDKEEVLKYLEKESAVNLFIIGDIENYGMEAPFMELWADIKGQCLKAILLRYYNYFTFYSRDNDYDVRGIDRLLRYQSIIEGLSGKKTAMDYYIKRSSLKFEDVKETHFLRLSKPIKKVNSNDKFTVTVGSIKDVEGVIELYESIDEFQNVSKRARESLIMEIKKKATRLYLIKEGDKIISTARTTAENSRSAMIISVATRKEYRNKGLATKCITKLCEDLQAEGKELCLFYDNPKAGSIYKKLGFEELEKWIMIKKIITT